MSDDKELLLKITSEKTLKDLVYEVRDQKVMLDSDLARIYGYETKNFNRQVKNNLSKFPKDFMFRLNKDETFIILRSKKLTSKNLSSYRRYNPYVFTEQGIYMLMTVLKGELAAKQSIALIRLFKSMKDYVVDSNSILNTNELLRIGRKVEEHELAINKISNDIEKMMDNFIDPSTYKHFLILNGERLEADVAYRKIYSSAKESIVIVDDYIGIKTLELLKVCNQHIKITIYSDNVSKEKVTGTIINDFHLDTGIDISIKPTNSIFHDRYILIDYGCDNEALFHCGPSSKDAGNRIGTIMKIENIVDYHKIIDNLAK